MVLGGPLSATLGSFLPCLFQLLLAASTPWFVAASSNLCLCPHVPFTVSVSKSPSSSEDTGHQSRAHCNAGGPHLNWVVSAKTLFPITSGFKGCVRWTMNSEETLFNPIQYPWPLLYFQVLGLITTRSTNLVLDQVCELFHVTCLHHMHTVLEVSSGYPV